MPLQKIKYCKIFPGIGIARLGDSPEEYFVGPETPGLGPAPETQFKDRAGRIKRQAARFRIYGFDENDNAIAEITARSPGAAIVWRVAIANLKASSVQFAGVKQGIKNDEAPEPDKMRNRSVQDRAMLRITPSPRIISGPERSGGHYAFDDGEFAGKAVYLGELRTDDAGRLLVLGGRGRSGCIPGATPLTNYANNDGWHDDTSDGRVDATVEIKGKDVPVVGSSWVIVAPPKFAPYIRNVVSLYDSMADAYGLPVPEHLSFTKDIYPLFAAFSDQQWVNAMSMRGHGPRKGGSFRDPSIIAKLNDKTTDGEQFRGRIFERIRDGADTTPKQANYNFMPQLSGDEGDATIGDRDRWLSLTRSSFEILRRWSRGEFDDDWPGQEPTPISLEKMDIAQQPNAIDRASLELCVGGPFFPGIEITYTARYKENYEEAFRFDSSKIQPGEATCRMAVPWQADFYECREHWWPAQRPDDVLNEEVLSENISRFPAEFKAGLLAQVLTGRLKWDRGVGNDWKAPTLDDPALLEIVEGHAGDNDMLEKWRTLGFVIPHTTEAGEILQVEVGRSRFDGLDDRDYFHLMLNIDSYPGFLPKARQIAESFLADAAALMVDPRPGAIDDIYRFFPYSKDSFDQRMDEIYAFHQANASHDPSLDNDSPFQTRADMVERIRQFAPLNQLDGAWVRNVADAGPIDEVGSLLFSVWMDEVGDGDPEQNHANLYTNLLEKVGIHLPPINSKDYAYHTELLDSAYTVPLFELAISQFTRTFFPEILGMTLQLEWEVLALWPTVRLLRHFGLDPHFYELHIGIDNAANGHGAKARQAVDRFLDEVRRRGGDFEAQAVWRRIWIGYVAFATTGTLGNDLRQLLESRRRRPTTPTDSVRRIMEDKKRYGSLNHGEKSVDGQRINNLFEDSDAFMKALVKGGYIVPGDIENSSFFRLTSFAGPMYKVFTDAELRAWEEWTASLGETPSGDIVSDPAILMSDLISDLRGQQTDVQEHHLTKLVGPAPGDAGGTVAKSISEWIQEEPHVFMSVLADTRNSLIIPGHADRSPFVVTVLAADNAMTRAFENVSPESGGRRSWRQVMIDWINANCPIPVPKPVRAAEINAFQRRLTLTDRHSVLRAHPRGTVQGMGCVH